MGKKYYEVVFEGKFDVICGMLEGFLLGKDAGWEWYSSKEAGIESESFTDIIKEWASLKTRLQHIILVEEFHNALQKAVKDKGDLRYIKLKYTKSAKEIKNCSFNFTSNAFAKKYGDEIKGILSAPPAGVSITDYVPVEQMDESAIGVELYAPAHDYSFKCSGIAEGDFGRIIEFRKFLDDHPLIHVGNIKLVF